MSGFSIINVHATTLGAGNKGKLPDQLPDKLARLQANNYHQSWPAADYHNFLTSAHHRLFILCDEADTPIGFSLFQAIMDEAELLMIIIDKAYRGKGQGEKLLAASLETLAATGVKRAILDVSAENQPAFGLYQKLGFAIFSRRKAYYQPVSGSGPSVDGLMMEKFLG